MLPLPADFPRDLLLSLEPRTSSLHSTLDEYIATLCTSVQDGAQMRTNLQVSGRPAELLLDTGTVGVNLVPVGPG